MQATSTRQGRAARSLTVAVLVLFGTGCGGGGGGGSGSQAAASPPAPATETVQKFVDADAAARRDYAAAPVTVSGKVLDTEGQPLPGVSVVLGAETTFTEQDGTFTLTGLTRSNAWLQLDGPTIRRDVFPVALGSAEEASIELPALVASPNDGATRLLFAGDTSFGRRFLDPEGEAGTTEVPASNGDALIQVDDPLPGSRAALSFAAPLIEQADYPVVNFESPILTDPATPHPTKDYVFFSLPGSLPALKELGIDYLSLGNNHVYDYLAQGLDDTLAALNDAQINHSGAAQTPDDAYAPFRVELANQPYSLVSATSVAGSQHDILYVADETQGGAADLRDDVRLQDVISMESAASRFVIAQLHTGKEYLFSPSQFALERMITSVAFGADLVVAHHPHVAQGVSYENGVLMYHGLGNFLFDQDRHETMLGLLAQVDVDGQRVLRARARPVYLEDYRPRPITGDLANRFLRRISEFSSGAAVIPYNAEAWIEPDMGAFSRVEQSIDVGVTVPDSGVAVVDLRHRVPSDFSLATVSTGADAPALRVGRDILVYGDFDDHDLDPDRLEAVRWNTQSSASFTCQAPRYRGPQALCLTRSASNQSDTVVAFRNRVRVMGDALNTPNKDLTLVAYLQADNAGPFSIVSRYYPSSGTGDFGEEAMMHPGGTFGWQLLHRDLNMPADMAQFDAEPERNPRALRLFLRHSPMQSGVGMATVDEIAVVSWEEAIDPATELATPHARDFLRVEGAPGVYELTLGFVSYVPAATDQ